MGIRKRRDRHGAISVPAMRCTFTADNASLLSAYPWTDPRDIQPGTNQWVHVTADSAFANYEAPYLFDASGTLARRHRVYAGGICKGDITGVADTTVCGIDNNSLARTHIDLGSPMRRMVVSIKNAVVNTKMDNSVNFRVPTGSPPGSPVNSTTGDETIYHTAQILRDYGYLNGAPGVVGACSDPTVHLLNIWKAELDDGNTLLGQCRVKSEIVWQANKAYAKVVPSYFVVGATVIPTTPNGYMYNCIVAGTSHATTEPTWPTTIGATVTDGTVTWQCAPNVDYQTKFATLEITDDGSTITASFGGNYAVALPSAGTGDRIKDTQGATNTWVGFWNYHSSADSQRKMIEAWI